MKIEDTGSDVAFAVNELKRKLGFLSGPPPPCLCIAVGEELE